jgi:hypothetical protein
VVLTDRTIDQHPQRTALRHLSPPLIAICVLAAVAGVCCLVLPPHIMLDGPGRPAYGWPLIPWFALAWANVRLSASMCCYLVLGFALGLAQPVRWWLVSLAAVALPPVLLAVNMLHDWTRDATSHNLFPLEFLIYGFICLPAPVGAFLGALLRRWLSRPRPA